MEKLTPPATEKEERPVPQGVRNIIPVMPYSFEGGTVMSPEKLVAEIMYLSAMVNANTELCMFVRYSGHVDTLCVDITESKEAYHSKIFNEEAYTNNKKGTEVLENIRGNLVQILDEHNVPYKMVTFVGPEEAVAKTVESVTEGSELEDRVAALEKEMAELKRLVSGQSEERGATDVSE